MEGRGLKRSEDIDELPADKRACSSLESRPSTLNTSMGSKASTHKVRDTDMEPAPSTLNIPMDSTASIHEVRDTDMDASSLPSGSTRSEGLTRFEGDGERPSLASGITRFEGDGERPSLASGITRSESDGERPSLAFGLTRSEGDVERSSLASGSTRSEGDGERDSTHSSYESDNSLRDQYYSQQSSGEDLHKINKVLSSLSEEVNESGQLAVLTELCELLSFSSDSSFSSEMADSFSPLLVTMANHKTNAEIMLLSIRAITYLCDLNPRSAGFLVRHDAVHVLCHRLLAIEYLDVAEQCLQALEKISREQPLACLQSGAIMAILGYIDFFSTSVQRVALSTVENICKKLSADSPPFFIDALPILCNLLQYEDKQLVESVAICLIRIGKQIQASSELLDRICNDGLVQRTLQLIGSNSQMTLCQSTRIGLIGLLVMLVSGSTIAFMTLFEHNISNTVKDMLSTYHLSNGIQTTPTVDGHHSQLTLEVMKLLNELLPTIAPEKDGQPKTDKETFLLNCPNIVQKFGVDLLPILVEVVNSGVNLFICYGCLSVINKLIHFSMDDTLHSLLLQTANISSFLAGVFTRKDHHLTFLALQIVDSVMLKLPNVFLSSFIKEGVLFAIYTELSLNNGSKISPVFDDMELEKDGTKKPASQDIRRCPCFSFDACQSSKGSENGTCKLHRDTVQNLAKHVWMTYFEAESMNPEKRVTDTLRKLQTLSTTLVARVNKSLKYIYSSQDEEEIYEVLHQIMSILNEKDTISTFEFVESGVIKALVTYLSNDHLVGEEKKVATMNLCIMEKRFEVFGRLLLSCTVPSCEELPLLTLIRRLQSALSSVENFSIISSHKVKMKSHATVPFGRRTSYPCLAVQFVRENDENSLGDYIEDVVSVDPLLPLGEIEGYLWPRVSDGKTKNPDIGSENSKEKDTSTDSTISRGGTPDSTVASAMGDVHQVQEENPDLLLSSPSETSRVEQKDVEADVTDVHTDPIEEKEHSSPQENDCMDKDQVGGGGSEDTQPKLLLYWEGQPLNNKLTLYQSILEKQAEAEHDNSISQSSWTRIYRITYRRPVITQSSDAKYSHNEAQYPLLSLMSVSEVDLEKLGPTYDILFLLKSLEEINRLRFHLISRERMYAFAEGRTDNLDKLNVPVYEVCQNEFINSKLTEKLEQQMRGPMSVSVGGMPAWCTQLLHWCPSLFGFKARQKYFNLAALGRLPAQSHTSSDSNSGGSSQRHQNRGNTRKKFLVHRNRILESAAKMMEHHSSQKAIFEVEYIEEVGTGLGPTLEFYTLVCHEFQRSCLGMWRDNSHVLEAESSEFLVSPFGLFPRPWSPLVTTSKYSKVIEKFVLLGQIVAKALQDGRILDLPFSKAFYKLILGKALTLSDIQSIDPAFGRILLEFQGVIERKRYLQSHCEEKSHELEVCFRSTRIEDLCLDFTLPGYPDYILVSASDPKMVNLCNLEEYVTLIVDATTKSGISGQVEAFKLGFNQVFPITHLKVFTEEELERLLCGEHISWNSDELTNHIKFDHGYTIRSPPIENLLKIMQELDQEQQRAFTQFVTGAPRLPPGGLASLNPKLTIVRKHCSESIDAELPSVMTCANYLKLPPYSSKNIMKEKLLYAITEGQGSFHLS